MAKVNEKSQGFLQHLLFWTLVLGVNGQAKRSLSSLRRFFMSISGRTITSAAFQKRFSDPAAQMFKELFERLLEKSLSDRPRPLPPKLRRFREVLAVDSTAFSLHDRLAKHFRGYKSVGTRAMARISVQLGLSDHRLRRADVSSARLGETRFFRVTRELRDHLVIFDLGYFKIARFQALQRVGAHFVSRLLDGANPLILPAIERARPSSARSSDPSCSPAHGSTWMSDSGKDRTPWRLDWSVRSTRKNGSTTST